jgi:hypothetical protein
MLGRKFVIAGCLVLCASAPGLAADRLEFNRDIRPILSDACFRCHGPDKAARKGDLRLDQRDAAVESGAIAPGQPDESELIRRILSTDPDEMMPPPSAHKVLSAAQKDRLQQWIAAGAEYQPHWAFLAPRKADLPSVQNASWPRQPLDRFILAKLETQGWSPATEADRRLLARRAALDLTGLPPSPTQLETFLQDEHADAYERYVDELLASPAWGEHRARYWLDYARYADTHGMHFDNFREMWSYRDWVISAFNANMPFDQFTIEQLAGDLLPEPTLEQQIATGFNRCLMTTNEGGTILEENMVMYTRDRMTTTAQTWLGLSAGCAVCHDHKFDPLTQREFFQLAAFFNNTTQGALDDNIKDTPPVLDTPRAEDRARFAELLREESHITQQLAARRSASDADFSSWLGQDHMAEFASLSPSSQTAWHIPLNDGPGEVLKYTVADAEETVAAVKGVEWAEGYLAEHAAKRVDGRTLEFPAAGDFDADQPFSCSAWIKIDKEIAKTQIAVVARMDDKDNYRGWDVWLERGKLGCHIIHHWSDNAIKVVAKNGLKPDVWTHVAITYDGSRKAAGVKVFVNGDAQPTTVENDNLRDTTRTEAPFTIGQRWTKSRAKNLLLQELWLLDRTLSAEEIHAQKSTARAAYLAGRKPDKRTDPERTELLDWWLENHDTAAKSIFAQQQSLAKDLNQIRQRGTKSYVMHEKEEPATAYVLNRGEYDQRRDQVTPDTPQFLPPWPEKLPRNRLGFARWLLTAEQPLTARVFVNRAWQEVFGQGLVRTSHDLGVAGELPSHQELLDYLAVEFSESGWDIKKLYRGLVLSTTYRQAAVVSKAALEFDSGNRLMSHGPRFRMDAEMIRDYALATSGLLSRTLGGPSVKPYQPEGVWEAVAMIGSNTRVYQQDHADKLYRRGLYTFWKRAAPPAALDILNAPSRETCTMRRERTNTPLQALVTLNDPQFIEAARHVAQRMMVAYPQSASERLSGLAQEVLLRPLTIREQQILFDSLVDHVSFYQSHSDDTSKLLAIGESPIAEGIDRASLAAWTMVASELYNLDETLSK